MADHPILSLSPAEVIRATQEDMRNVALNATPGPWSAFDLSEDGREKWFHYGDFGWYVRGPVGSTEFEDSEQGKADAEHVAAWHPPVALAMAEFLGSAIPYARLARWQDFPQVTDALAVCREWWQTRPVPATDKKD